MSDDHRSKVYDPILDYPEFAATLGQIVSQGTYLEAQLVEIFSHIASTEPEKAAVLYWSFPTFNQRRRVMDKLLEKGYQPHAAEIKSIIRRAKNFVKFRNSAVHDLWCRREIGGSPVYRMTVNLIRDSEPGEVRMKLAEMREAVENGIKLNADLSDLINKIG